MANHLRLRSIVTWLCAAALWAHPGMAAELKPLQFGGLYELSFSGLRFGKLGVELKDGGKTFEGGNDVTFTGIVRVFVQHESHTTVKGTRPSAGNAEYESRYRTKGKPRRVYMVYRGGELKEHEVEPPENPAKRPPPTAEMLKGTFDPLTFLFRMREELHAAMNAGTKEFSMEVFDGRRLYEAQFTVKEKEIIRVRDRKLASIEVGLRRKPLAGFTGKELGEIDPDEPEVRVWFSDDASLIPLVLEVTPWYGTLRAELRHRCAAGESCLLGLNP